MSENVVGVATARSGTLWRRTIFGKQMKRKEKELLGRPTGGYSSPGPVSGRVPDRRVPTIVRHVRFVLLLCCCAHDEVVFGIIFFPPYFSFYFYPDARHTVVVVSAILFVCSSRLLLLLLLLFDEHNTTTPTRRFIFFLVLPVIANPSQIIIFHYHLV